MSVTGAPAEWRTNLETLRQALVAAQDERPKRQEWVTLDDGSTELAWVLYERERMLQAVNDLRARAGKAPVPTEQVRSAETGACGHVDYTMKFAIACADLVAQS